MITRMLPLKCPRCKSAHDCITDVGHKDPPCEGDVVICSDCGSVNVITDGKLILGKQEHMGVIPDRIIEGFQQLQGIAVMPYGEET